MSMILGVNFYSIIAILHVLSLGWAFTKLSVRGSNRCLGGDAWRASKGISARCQMLALRLNWTPKNGHTRGHQVYKCGDCKRKQTVDTEHAQGSEIAKRQASQMRLEVEILSAAARVVGESVASVSGCLGGEAIACERMRAMSNEHTSGRAAMTTIAFD